MARAAGLGYGASKMIGACPPQAASLGLGAIIGATIVTKDIIK